MKKTTLFMRFLSLAVFVSVVIVSPMYGGDPNNCAAVQGVAQITCWILATLILTVIVLATLGSDRFNLP